MLKIIASMMVIAASSLLGISLSKKYTERVKGINRFITALTMLESEIKFSLTPLSDAFMKIGNTIGYEVGGALKSTADMLNMRTGETAAHAWETSINSRFLPLNKEDLDILLSFGKSLGISDCENQIKNIQLTVEGLKRNLTSASEESMKNKKIFTNLGVLFGIFIVILLL